MSGEKSMLRQIKGPSNFWPLNFPLWFFCPLIYLAPELTFPTLVLNITPGKQNILWHHHSWHNYFKPASLSGKVFGVHLSGRESKRSRGICLWCPKGSVTSKTKCTASPWTPTSWRNVPILRSRLIPVGWFCFHFAIRVSVSHRF